MATKYTGTYQAHFDENKFQRQRWIHNMFNRHEEYYRNEIYRMIHNQRMYWGINFGQWPAYAVEKLIAQGRKPPTFNIIAKKIETQIGSILSNGFDMKYETRSGDMSQWALHLQDMMYSDKCNCDWETAEIVALRDMHVMVGYERMYISDRFDSDFGNIAWEALPPTHIYPDINWKTPNAFDIENYFEWGMYHYTKIAEMYPKAAPMLREQMERERIDGVDYGEYNAGPSRYNTVEEKWGSQHKVITFHSIRTEEREWEYDLINRCNFPETGYPNQSKEDIMVKKAYMEQARITGDDVTTIKQRNRVKMVEAICPTLHCEEFLVAGKDQIQTKNVNLYPVGNSFYGQFRGMVDDLEDIQIDFNKNKMSISDIMSRSAKGAFILDKAITGGDDRVREQIESQWNNPAARIWADEGTTAELGAHGGMIALPQVQPNAEMFRLDQESLQLADWLTVPAAMSGRTEGAGESGKLMEHKVQLGIVGQKYGMKIFERHKREKALAYPIQAKITYSGYPRQFNAVGKPNPVILNQPGVNQMNERVIINDISTMPEMNVTVTPSTSGLTVRSEMRKQYAETLQILNDPRDRALKLLMVKNIYETQDMPQEKKEEIGKMVDMMVSIEAMTMASQYKQVEMQMKQLMNPPEPPTDEIGTGDPTMGGFDEEQAKAGTPQQAPGEDIPQKRKQLPPPAANAGIAQQKHIPQMQGA